MCSNSLELKDFASVRNCIHIVLNSVSMYILCWFFACNFSLIINFKAFLTHDWVPLFSVCSCSEIRTFSIFTSNYFSEGRSAG